MPIIGGRQIGVRGLGFQGAGKPNQVTGLTATDFGTSRAYNDGRIDLSWSTPANNGAPITGYRIERSTDGSSYSAISVNTGTTATTYSDTGLNSNQVYYYKVAAINAVDTGTLSTAANATATTVPQAPTVTVADVGTGRAYNNGAATVTITGGATGGKAISSYTATSSPGSFTATSGSPLTVTGLQSNTSYTFSVTATNANGSSTATVSGSITATTVPQAPTIGTATGGIQSATVTYTANATGGKTVTTFTATSSPGSITGTGSSPITVSGLTGGTSYTFTVTATNANGTSTASSASNSITAEAAVDFIVYNFYSTGNYATSSDGITWTQRTNPASLDYMACPNWSDTHGVWIWPRSNNSATFYTSTDGVNWTSNTASANLSNANTGKPFTKANGRTYFTTAGQSLIRTTNLSTFTSLSMTGSVVNTGVYVPSSGYIFIPGNDYTNYSSNFGDNFSRLIFGDTSTQKRPATNNSNVVISKQSSTVNVLTTNGSTQTSYSAGNIVQGVIYHEATGYYWGIFGNNGSTSTNGTAWTARNSQTPANSGWSQGVVGSSASSNRVIFTQDGTNTSNYAYGTNPTATLSSGTFPFTSSAFMVGGKGGQN